MDKLVAWSRGVLIHIHCVHNVITKQIPVPQSNIKGPYNSNVVIGSVFGSLHAERNTTVKHGNVSVIMSVLPTIRYISVCKTASAPGKKPTHYMFASFNYCVVVVTVSW